MVLVDDLSDYIHPSQREHWIPIPVFDPQRPDEELSAVLKELCRRVSSAD